MLFDHDGSDHQLKINKAAITDKATLLFQSGYNGHAEMGLMGDADFNLKLSSDGQTFTSALTARSSDGYIGIGTDSPLTKLHNQERATLITLESTDPGKGAAFDLRNLADDQSWRITGTQALFKIRDHTAALDKLVLFNGTNGDVHLKNCGNFGIGTTNPTAKLHVDGAIRPGVTAISALPSAATSGAGSLIFVSDAAAGPEIAYSDGSDWRRMSDQSIIS